MPVPDRKTNDIPSWLFNGVASKSSKTKGQKTPKVGREKNPPMKIGDYEGYRKLKPPPVPSHLKPPKTGKPKDNMDLLRMLHSPNNKPPGY